MTTSLVDLCNLAKKVAEATRRLQKNIDDFHAGKPVYVLAKRKKVVKTKAKSVKTKKKTKRIANIAAVIQARSLKPKSTKKKVTKSRRRNRHK